MEILPYNYDDAVDALKVMINDWISLDSKRSKTSLARASDVSEATIRRIVNDGILPLPHNICKIVSFIKGISTNHDLIEKSGDALAPVLSFHLPYLAFEASKEYSRLSIDAEQALNSPTKRLIFTKSGACNDGVLADQIISEFGKYGIKEANELVSLKLLKFLDNRYFVSDEFRDFSMSPELSKLTILEMVKLYFKEHFETNYSFNVTDGVSLSGYNSVMDVMQEAHERISKIVKENPGKYPLFVTGVMDTLTVDNAFLPPEEKVV